jgi:predicted membrane-bound spermidine synthase
MSPSARARRIGLAIAAGAVLVGLVAGGFAPPRVLELVGHDQERWVERFATGQDEVVVRVTDGGGSLPYVLPGPADTWAGGKPHRVRVPFTAPHGDHELLLKVADAHAQAPPLLAVSVNGREVGRIQLRPGMGDDARDTQPMRRATYRLRIPGAALDSRSEQTLVLESRGGAWVWLSGLWLSRRAPTFSLGHYFDPGPPPRFSLVALAIGLLALWAADGPRCRPAALALLGAGLGPFALLAIAPWPPTGFDDSVLEWKVLLSSPRAVWLLLALAALAAQASTLPRLPPSRLLGVTAFATGAIVMVLEMVGFRLLSPFFGYSLYLWGSLLGVIMAALALGYALGGRLADRRPSLPLLYGTLLGTAVLLLASLYAYPAIIRVSVRWPLVSGSVLAAVLLCFVPMVGLSLTPPFVIRAMAATGTVGITAGRIYAASTAGSILGTLASAFVLITALGPQTSWILAGLVLLLVAAYGLFHYRGTTGLALALLVGFLVALPLSVRPRISVAELKGGTRIYATDSEYSHLEVIEVGKTLRLVPQLRFTHTIYDEDRPFDPIVSHGLLPAALTEPRRLLDLGMGGGTLARLYLQVYPEIRVDAVDIDGETVRLGRRFFGLRDDPRLRIFIEDARTYLRRATGPRYDVVIWDLFQGGVFIPYYTLTRESFELSRQHLSDGGVLALFLARPRPLEDPRRQERYARLYMAVGNTLTAVFPSVFVYPLGDIGYYFLAVPRPLHIDTVRARLSARSLPQTHEVVRVAVESLQEYRTAPGISVLTDDLAPVDQLIYDAFFRQ